MRDRTFWKAHSAKEIRNNWPTDRRPTHATRLFRVELGLYLLERLCPGEPAIAAWPLLGGYPFALVRQRTPERERTLRVARHLLWTLRRPRTWERALRQYASFPVELRGYRIPDPNAPAVRNEPAVLTERWQEYEQALTSAPPFHRRTRLAIARTGRSYRFPQGKLLTSVRLPPHLPVATTRRHALVPPPTAGDPIRTTLDGLLATAQWMDQKLGITDPRKTWERRVQRISLDVLDSAREKFRSLSMSDTFSITGLLHLVGMVGAGKSTLRDVLTVQVVRDGRRVTIVVGDVAEQLRLVGLFRELELKVAPVLGASTRARNVQRMHRRLTGSDAGPLLSHDAQQFRYLSTACPLDALRGGEALQPLEISDAPCTRLQPASPAPNVPESDEQQESGADRTVAAGPDASADAATGRDDRPSNGEGCPLWGACPRHRGAQDLVDADIWVANPASLVYGLTPRHQNRERARFLEVACVRSDLIVVDEADRVQMQLDTMFVPSATLVGRAPDSWLDALQTHTTGEFARKGRLQLSEAEVDRWSSSLTASIAATNRLYSLLMRHRSLRDWIRHDYFSSWTLQQKLLDAWFPVPKARSNAPDDEADDEYEDETEEETEEEARDRDDLDDEPSGPAEGPEGRGDDERTSVTAVLDAFRDDPLGGHPTDDPKLTALIDLARALLHTLDEDATRAQAVRTLTQVSGIPHGDDETSRQRTLRFEFTLLVCVLQQRLDVLTELWPAVEATLSLEATDNQLSRRPPLDYGPLLPESPMGNILGFQLLTENLDDEAPAGAELRFFRCTGVGRALLTSLHQVNALDGGPTAHVLLMSGTSWAGTAAGAHVLAPVGAILKASPRDQAALLRTTFRKVFVTGPDGKPLHLSGTRPDLRPKVLEHMLEGLARPREGALESTFEEELRLISGRHRKRLLLLVGSYEEARRAFDVLNGMPPWKGKVIRLIPDDAELEISFGGADPGDRTAGAASGTLPRGEVAAFGEMDAKILIAPLMSVERGHNVLNGAGQAAIGSVFFLARPHPRPYDIGIAVQGINSWVTRMTAPDGGFADLVSSAADLDEAGRSFRRAARIHWKHLLTRNMAWRALDDTEKVAFTWDRLVVMWQVIGRLVRGGVPARVVFVDARFAVREASGRGEDDFRSGLLASMRHVLAPYFDESGRHTQADRHLVKTLYEPLYRALDTIAPYRPDTPRRTAGEAA